MNNLRYFCVAFAGILACPAAPDVDGVPLGGVVEDQNGGVVIAAKLTLTNKESGAELKAKPDAEGQFRFASVPAGAYTLKVKAESFETVEISVKIGNNAPKPLRVRMELKGRDEEVTVTSERQPGLDLDPGENSNAIKIDENLLMALPVDGEDVLGTLGNFLSPAAQGAMGPSVVVDGMEADMYDVPAWSIKRIRINKNPYSAQFRRPGNARVEVTTRDSRSNFHGGIAIFERDSTLDARNPLALTKPDTSKRLLEARVTGPIHGHPFWYFFNIERKSDQESATVNALTLEGPVNKNVATPAEQTNFLGRIDIRPNQMHSMSVRYATIDTGQRNRGVGGFRLPEGGYAAGERQRNVQFSDHRIWTAGFNNDFRIQFERGEDHEGSLATLPSVIVKGAFTAGPSQNFDSEHETTYRLQNLTNYYKGRHRLQFGGQVRPRTIDARQQSDFAGVFEFASLERFAAAQPYVFRFNRGDPALSFTQHEAFDFVQDQILVTRNLHILAGVRHEWHGNLAKAHHLAPRIGLAWSPDERKKTVLRIGTGIFYESLPKAVIRRSLLFDGVKMREFVISSPSFPDPFADATAALLPPSIVRTAPDLTLPYLVQASAGIEHALTQKVQLTVEYRTLRALHVYRSRDVNAPLPATQIRPDANFGKITDVESTGTMRSNAVDIGVRWSAKRFAGMAQYTLSRTNDDAYGLFGSPANNYDLRGEWGRADYDRRHQVNLMGSTTLPGKIRVGTVTSIGSGLPFNVTTGEDNNGDTVAADRPSGVTRNTGIGGGLVQVNLRFTKLFEARRLYKKHKKDFTNLELNVDAFNILNHTNFERFVGVLNSPFFGRANAAMPGRTFQTSVRYSW